MMAELNFKNLSITYDDAKISKSLIRKNKVIAVVGALCIFIGLIVIGLLSTLINIENGFCILIFDLTFMLLVLCGGFFAIDKIHQKVSPKHFDLVTWLMKFKHDEIESGWLNDRFVVELWDGRGSWMKYGLQKFIGCDYTLIDNSDKTKPIFMIVDLMTEVPKILISNSK